MRTMSWDMLSLDFRNYHYTAAVGRFVDCAARELHPLALILFGSLARGDYHTRSDADVCLILNDAPPTPFVGYDMAAACDPSGVVQPLVYGADQFRQMVDQANGLALEVMADGICLVGEAEFVRALEAWHQRSCERWGIERTPGGWRLRYLDGTGGAVEQGVAVAEEG